MDICILSEGLSLFYKRMSIDQMEYAKVHDKAGLFKEYAYGTYEEVEDYCKKNDSYVELYLGHVDPMTVQKGFRYVGRRSVPPCDPAKPYYNEHVDPETGVRGVREFKEKW